MTQRSTPSRLVPTLLWAGYVLTAVWAIAVRMTLFTGPGRPFYLRPFSFGAGLALANAITFWLSVKVRRDFPRGSASRRAWQFMVASVGLGVVRYVALWLAGRGMQGPGGGPGGGPPMMPIAQVIGLLSVILLLAALLLMRSPFVRLGLGRLRRMDWIAIGVLIAVTPLLYLLRQNAPVTPYRLPLLIAVQQFDPILIVGSVIAGILLLRIGRDLEGGSLSVSFRHMMFFGIARLAALLVVLFPIGVAAAPFTAASLASDWLIAIAVYYRWRLTSQANEMAKEYEPPK